MLVYYLFTWAAWWGSLATVMLVERRIRRGQNAASGHVDFADDRIGSFLLLGLLCGGFVLPFYFYITRRSAGAVLMGALLMVPCWLATAVVGGIAHALFVQ